MTCSGWSVGKFVPFIETSFPYHRFTSNKNIHNLQGYSTAIANGENLLFWNPNKNYPTSELAGQFLWPELAAAIQNTPLQILKRDNLSGRN
ncbi:hypothetical protein Zmor_023491 [Zophobas morio]|uniref:Uncharacterized protein n=1 Tax=Zophobas morio TaxID=2755281 RepID=A0AA38HX35_9CUCU|nr:hypothetical protein Zmor_023491 [Zophobas morio]